MRPDTTPEQKAEIIYRFFNDNDKRLETIATVVDVNITSVKNAINDYFKNKKPDKEIFLIRESKLNSMPD